MKKKGLYIQLMALFLLLSSLSHARKPSPSYVEIETSKGSIIVKLYDETPQHRDMFLKMVREKKYNGAAFNRVIKSFVIQGGELDDAIMEREKAAGKEGPRIAAELNDNLFHKKGALGAGRNDNPEKKSFVNQFYIVQGKPYTDAQMDEIEIKRLKGKKIPAWQREIYKTQGGTPFLDHDYTIFGEVVKGLDVVDAIASIATGKDDKPLEDLKIKMRVLSDRQAALLHAGS